MISLILTLIHTTLIHYTGVVYIDSDSLTVSGLMKFIAKLIAYVGEKTGESAARSEVHVVLSVCVCEVCVVSVLYVCCVCVHLWCVCC